jgi:hypothetical protein
MGVFKGDDDKDQPAPARAPFTVPWSLRQFGLASWLVIGVAIVVLGVLALTGALFTLFAPCCSPPCSAPPSSSTRWRCCP